MNLIKTNSLRDMEIPLPLSVPESCRPIAEMVKPAGESAISMYANMYMFRVLWLLVLSSVSSKAQGSMLTIVGPSPATRLLISLVGGTASRLF